MTKSHFSVFGSKTDLSGDIAGLRNFFLLAPGFDSKALPVLGFVSPFVIISGGIGALDGCLALKYIWAGEGKRAPLREKLSYCGEALIGIIFKANLVVGGLFFLPFRITTFISYYVNSGPLTQASSLLGNIGGVFFAVAYSTLIVACIYRIFVSLYKMIGIYISERPYIAYSSLNFEEKAEILKIIKDIDTTKSPKKGEDPKKTAIRKLLLEKGPDDFLKKNAESLAQLYGHKISTPFEAQMDCLKSIFLNVATITTCSLGVAAVILGFVLPGHAQWIVSLLWGTSNIIWLGIDAYWLKKAFDRQISMFQKVTLILTSLFFCVVVIGALFVAGNPLGLVMVLTIEMLWMMLISYCLYRLIFG